jgi:hypothetical protein
MRLLSPLRSREQVWEQEKRDQTQIHFQILEQSLSVLKLPLL